MSISKKYTEPGTYSSQQGFRSSQYKQRSRRQSVKLQPYSATEQSREPALEFDFRHLWVGVQRFWIAFRFQSHRFTFGMFKRRAILKLGFLGLAGYFLLSGDSVANEPVAEDVPVIQSVGTSLEWKESGQIIPLPTIAGKKIKNEAAPVSKNEIIPFNAGKYIDRFKQISIDEMEKYGVPASISLAQGLIESRAGSSKLAVNNNNHFGIKCFSRKCKKGHCSNFTDDTHKDFFRIFKTPWESWREHSKLLTNKRFSRLKKYGRDYKKWAHGLESLGYATDRSYAEKLIGIIERYNLNKYDR
ncbi:MAG: glucosaminidase domain-containing protein [Saprospiraceae bacterium]